MTNRMKLIKNTGIKPYFLGLDYIEFGLDVLKNQRYYRKHIVELYRLIGAYFKVSLTAVERDIRYAIKNSNYSDLTNKQFLLLVLEEL